MYHNFVFCEGVADTGVRGKSSECNFIMKISCTGGSHLSLIF